MFLDPLLKASPVIQFHVATVVPAAIVGAVVLFRRKGTRLHRMLGKIWVVLMVATAVSTFFIHTINIFHGFSPIHLLSVATIAACIQAVLAARRGDIVTHRRIMRGLYVSAIGIAGVFTLYPGRIMHRVVFGVPDVFANPAGSNLGWPIAHAGETAIAILAVAALLVSIALVARARRARETARFFPN